MPLNLNMRQHETECGNMLNYTQCSILLKKIIIYQIFAKFFPYFSLFQEEFRLDKDLEQSKIISISFFLPRNIYLYWYGDFFLN